MSAPISQAFLASLPEEQRVAFAAASDLEQTLAAALSVGHLAWPGLPLPTAVFAAYLGQRVALREQPLEALRSLHVADLYLMCAFLHGVPGAAEALEQGYLAALKPLLQRLGISTQLIEDVQQTLCIQLLSTKEGTGSGSGYEGRGSLHNWLRVTATREARRSLERGRRDLPLFEDATAGFVLAGTDPALEHMQHSFQAEFKAAFQEALATLTPRERNLLRFYFVDGLNIDEIGAVQRVNRSTVSRWISSLRSRLLGEIRKGLVQRLRVPQPDLDSMMQLIDSQIHLSLQRILGHD